MFSSHSFFFCNKCIRLFISLKGFYKQNPISVNIRSSIHSACPYQDSNKCSMCVLGVVYIALWPHGTCIHMRKEKYIYRNKLYQVAFELLTRMFLNLQMYGEFFMWLSNCLAVLLLFSYVVLECVLNAINICFMTNIQSIFVNIPYGLGETVFSNSGVQDS